MRDLYASGTVYYVCLVLLISIVSMRLHRRLNRIEEKIDKLLDGRSEAGKGSGK